MDFYRETRSGDRVMVGRDVVKVERSTCTSNPQQPARKWFVTARPRDPQRYAEKKLASGEWSGAPVVRDPESWQAVAAAGRKHA